MSSNRVEQLLWQLAAVPGEVGRFQADPLLYVEELRLEEDEKRLILDMDVGAMGERGINPLLLMMAFRVLKGNNTHDKYLNEMNSKSS